MTLIHTAAGRGRRVLGVAVMAATLALSMFAVAAGTARAEFGISAFDGIARDVGGGVETQAGSHPDLFTSMSFATTTNPDDGGADIEQHAKDVVIDLPPGLVGDPRAMPRCPASLLTTGMIGTSACPNGSQVGVVRVTTRDASGLHPEQSFGLYNMIPGPGKLAQFAFNVVGVPVYMTVSLRPGDHGLRIGSFETSQGLRVIDFDATIWGVPADPSHDGSRASLLIGGFPALCGSEDGVQTFPPCVIDEPRRPLTSLGTDCSTGPVTTHARASGWLTPKAFSQSSFVSHDNATPPNPVALIGCGAVPFEPSASVEPTSTVADGPTGMDVDLRFESSADPDGLSASPLKRAVVRLPEGMSVNPAGADGLAACSDEQLGLETDATVACPEASKIGSASATSPVLERFDVNGQPLTGEDGQPLPEPITGSVYVRSQASSDPMSGDLFRLALVLENKDRGLLVKLAGRVTADPDTGRLVATFDNNPQLPVERVLVSLKSGPRAPLALPATCGVKSIETELTSWSGKTETFDSQFTVPCPANTGFEPGFEAGSTNPIAGDFSPFAARIVRGERDQFLSGVSVDLPRGLLAKLAGVQLCPDAVAGDGTPGVCPSESLIGTATVGAGSGNPFYLQGPVYLTGPYKGAPYGLSVHVPAQAGPFDLGLVKVRQRIEVDPETADIAIASDPLPQIVKGVPVRLRDVRVETDRPGFTINPTSCKPQQIHATLTSTQGQVREASQRYGIADCATLGFRPRMAMRLTGRRQTKTGGHPALTTTVTQGKGQANIASAKVTLPRSIVLDPNNTADPKMLCGYDEALQANCPASTVIGKATARTPVLDKPLTGNVHLVQGIKFGKTGNRIRTTPSLLVKLRGQVAINLRANTTTEKGTNHLVTTFASVPDAPVSKFTLKVNGGRKGILVVTRTARRKLNLCSASQVANVETDGQNGKRADFATKVKTPCRKDHQEVKRGK